MVTKEVIKDMLKDINVCIFLPFFKNKESNILHYSYSFVFFVKNVCFALLLMFIV